MCYTDSMKIKVRAKYDNDTVLDILRREGIYLCADCGGNGSCGKCRVRFTDPGSLKDPTEADWKAISEHDLANGFRLACNAVIESGSTACIEIPSSSIIHEGSPGPVEVNSIEPLSPSEIIAVDFGTTMIYGALVDLNKGITGEASIVNHQKAYGADVISRIKASSDGYGEELRHVAEEDLAELALRLHRDPDQVRYIISGNTVMEHIISGFPLKGLGEYPYTPVDISLRRDGNMTFLPGLSGFVGADIVSGICACSLDKAEAPWLYVDIGTNGEMALGAAGKVMAASAPAGPAFEGGLLSHGVPAVTGAISSVVLAGRKAVITIVDDAKPCGICGSGAIDLISELLKNNIMDRNGTLSEEFAEDGYTVSGDIVLTQKDIREIQKAKSAIRAGIDTLVEMSGVPISDISKLVIAGSFGSGIDMENACRIGMIPEELLGKIAVAGNASLTGATLYALDTGFSSRLKDLISRAEVIDLSTTPGFDQRFVSNMVF